MIESIIKDYLLTNKTVIIPQIGTLTITNDDTLDIMFLSYLKFDDKKLTETHARITGNSIVESKLTVYDWIDQLIKDLDSGQQRPIGDLGFFFKNSSGEYEFNTNILEVSNEPTTSITVAEETPIIIEEIPASVITEEPTSINIEEVIENEVVTEQTEEIRENNPEINEEQTEQPEKIVVVKEKTTKKKSKLPLIIGILLLLALSSTAVVIWKDKLFKTSTETEQIQEEIAIEEEEIQSEIQTEEIIVAEPQEVETEQNNDFVEVETEKNDENYLSKTITDDYYVIVGSFEDENNAIRLINNLKSKEYKAELINEFGFKMVSIARFHTREEAEMKRKEVGSAWIFKK
ncbi:MAG TPA: SPOR domain-containing protein [Crocinitomicaceae bacterium]|nr:SPOR domain-containing protein [Crocinitomicaceae bacterium]